MEKKAERGASTIDVRKKRFRGVEREEKSEAQRRSFVARGNNLKRG